LLAPAQPEANVIVQCANRGFLAGRAPLANLVARALAKHRAMPEIARGVWHWEAPHPDWAGPENEAFRQRLAATAKTPNEAARGLVSSYAIDDGDRLLLLDPLAVPREIEELAAGANRWSC
jgi:hypothetical protein